jgi:hypothetical protein
MRKRPVALKRHGSKQPQQHEKFGELVAQGVTIKDAMLQAGYSAKQARKGRAALSKPMVDAALANGIDMASIGARLDPTFVENAIAGKLYQNMIAGENGGNEAAKLLGGMKKYDTFRPESQTGVVIIQAPAAFREEIEAKMLEASIVHTVENSG